MHGSQPMTLCPNLCNDAQNYADHLASTGTFEHDSSIQGVQGENLAAKSHSASYPNYNGATKACIWKRDITITTTQDSQ